jgi:DNA primase
VRAGVLRTFDGCAMAEEWLTYADLGERLGISSEAARQKAIRYRWRRRQNNRGKTEVLVDMEEVREHMERYPLRKPKDEPSDPRPTPEEQVSDTRMLAALDAHIESLKAMVAKAESIADRERERADGERERADVERARADRLQCRIDELLAEQAKAANQQEAVRDLEAQIAELRAIVSAPQRSLLTRFFRRTG